jgi:hypothetical protein
VPSLPKVHVPVVVTTEGVDKGLSDAERKIKASAKRMERTSAAPSGASQALKAAGTSALGIGGFGAIGGAAGALGLGGVGAAAALSAPFAISSKLMETMNEATKGATKALEDFRKTGEQTFAANSVILERLAMLEKSTAKSLPSLGQVFTAAGVDAETGKAAGMFEWARDFQDGLRVATAAIGAFAGGKTPDQIRTEMLLATSNEAGALQLKGRIAEEERIRQSQGDVGMLGRLGDIYLANISNQLKQLVQLTS